MDFEESTLQAVNDLKKIMVEDRGKMFTFFKFVYFLIKIAIYVFSDPNNIPKKFRLLHFTSDEKFYMLLERLEISQGFFDLTAKKVNKKNSPRLTLLTKELADMHKETSAFPNFEEYLDENENSTWMLLNFDFDVKKTKKSQFLFQRLYSRNKHSDSPFVKKTVKKLKFMAGYLKSIQYFKEDLNKIFLQYSMSKGKNKKSEMNCFKFIKFLKDAKLVRSENAFNSRELEEDR